MPRPEPKPCRRLAHQKAWATAFREAPAQSVKPAKLSSPTLSVNPNSTCTFVGIETEYAVSKLEDRRRVTSSPPRRLIPLLRCRGTIHRALFSFSLPTPPSTFRLLVSSLPFLPRQSLIFHLLVLNFC